MLIQMEILSIIVLSLSQGSLSLPGVIFKYSGISAVCFFISKLL